MQLVDVARRYADAIAAGDDAALLACYPEGARIWHNTDGQEQTPEQNNSLGRWLRRRVPDLTFRDVRNIATEDGFLRLSVMHGTFADGTHFAVPSCMVCTVSPTGLIERVEEYLDPTPFSALGS